MFLPVSTWLCRTCQDELLLGGVGKIGAKNTDAALMCSLLVKPAVRDAGAKGDSWLSSCLGGCFWVFLEVSLGDVGVSWKKWAD
jgi:hypothetical protein